MAGGSFTATVPARSAIAIHTGARGTGSGGGGGGGGTGTVAVSFAETAQTVFGEVRNSLSSSPYSHNNVCCQNVFLVGSISQLGTWDPAASVSRIPLNTVIS